jgi:hypothetical protein
VTDADIKQAAYDSVHLKWEIEDQVRYGSPSNVRVVLWRHPEHVEHVSCDVEVVRHTP